MILGNSNSGTDSQHEIRLLRQALKRLQVRVTKLEKRPKPRRAVVYYARSGGPIS